MKKTELASLLRKKISSARLPEKMDFKLENKCLTITLQEEGLKSNMQENSAAFESWAVALKYHLADEIAEVVIDWQKPEEMDAKQEQLYNRFLYRITKFTETYPWAKAAKPIEKLPSALVCNFPKKEASPLSAYKEGREGWLECKYVEKNKFKVMARQLPVGLFTGEVSEETRFTTDGALDIWAAKEDEIFLFELKKEGNKPLGIISELMFYAHAVSDIMRHKIEYKSTPELEKSKSKQYREFGKFYELYENQSVKKLHAVFLVDERHPLITSGLIDFINDSECFHKLGIRFSHKTL